MRDKAEHSLFELILLRGIPFRFALMFVVASKPGHAPAQSSAMAWEVSQASYGKMHVTNFRAKTTTTGC